MKICSVQLRSFKGDIEQNIQKHARFVRQAVEAGADLVFFPELSLSGYEPSLAQALATTAEDTRLDVFQQLSEEHQVIIAAGIPTKATPLPRISLLVFEPGKARKVYSKQMLHEDELPWFTPGTEQLILQAKGQTIALAICYESLQPVHAAAAAEKGAAVYLASVAKSANGVAKAYKHYPAIAAQHNMTVLMSNSIGPNDDFLSAGQSAVWNNKGELLAQLNDTEEGILVWDTHTGTVTTLNNLS